ncbi:hypothetical protein PF010_g6304 [Phytophthora fragariae]|uniref:Uncharacterized protein n=1 Tax=Phytophthora fragariae TaxID=53985 RepID=A0A6A3T2A7_9STRA|nr:hypothetical protein PF003_g7096 [Phytophthora fragariae]KAE9122699.1 hypothetical protein PF007_g7349 [Phytophthora fragariae]KAE9123700.1 hypothetical protein PF010_g6304 [Phytophthora fragariae]KAE9149326.1 hypothetical protein PF006_g6177 [Phytophthora fragariae]KAE9250275.1 hypothetical protein PF002_g4866 [Phytophthora fragariae]
MPQSGGDEGGVEERGRVIRCKHPVEELTAYARMSAVPVDMAEHASVETEAEDAKSEKKLRAGLTHPTVLLRGGGVAHQQPDDDSVGRKLNWLRFNTSSWSSYENANRNGPES